MAGAHGRVRSNQERLKSDGGGYYKVPIDASRDFYDEDDKGYEGPAPRNARGGTRSSALISHRPAGGSRSLSSSMSSLAGGIFSDRSASVSLICRSLFRCYAIFWFRARCIDLTPPGS